MSEPRGTWQVGPKRSADTTRRSGCLHALAVRASKAATLIGVVVLLAHWAQPSQSTLQEAVGAALFWWAIAAAIMGWPILSRRIREPRSATAQFAERQARGTTGDRGKGPLLFARCRKCDGRGGFPCRPCSGTGALRCNCVNGYRPWMGPAGGGIVPCPKCNTTMQYTCGRCGGAGGRMCKKCRGQGQVRS